MDSNLPVPNNHCEVLYRQTFNTYGAVETTGLTQDNRVGNGQKTGNTRLSASTNKGILAGSVISVVAEGTVGPATSALAGSDSTTTFDKVVGIAVNDAVGNPYESSSAVASNKVVYAHGTGTVIRTDIYETQQYANASLAITYTYGDKLFASRNGLLTNSTGLQLGTAALAGNAYMTVVGIVLQKPTTTDPFMVVQLKI